MILVLIIISCNRFIYKKMMPDKNKNEEKEEKEKEKKEILKKEKEKEEKEKIDKVDNEILNLQTKIKETKDEKEKIELYDKIIKLNNINENIILEYLKLLKNNEDESIFRTKLEKLQVCLSDDKYNRNFTEFPRNNYRIKLLNLLNFFIQDKTFTLNNYVAFIYYLLEEEEKIGFNSNKMVKWENNEELYLYSLYNNLLNSMFGIISFYINDKSVLEKLSKNEEYKNIDKLLQKLKEEEEKEKEEEEKIKKEEKKEKNKREEKNKMNERKIREERKIKRNEYIKFLKSCKESLILREGKMYDEYLINMVMFLFSIKDNFNQRFNDIQFNNLDDKIIFEHFINFISSYLFDGNDGDYICLWNEIFIPLKKEQKYQIIKSCNNKIYNKKIQLEYYEKPGEGEKIIINNTYTKSVKIIDNCDKYSFEYLINLIIRDYKEYKLDWYLNSSLKPDKYNTDLFVCKKGNFWKELLKNIFNSKAFNDIKTSFYNCKQIDFFAIDSVISTILDDIQFFLFKSIFYGKTIKDSLRIYEYGIYDIEIRNKSIALLIFYGFHIVVNIHEIAGHFYARFQLFYSQNNAFESPKIEEKEQYLYSSYGINGGSESGEKVEIALFGSVIKSLTIKEALFILNINNYNQKVETFKENFKKCNDIEVKNLIDASLEQLLNDLGINPSELVNEQSININKRYLKKDNTKGNYLLDCQRHPIDFYYRKPSYMKALEIIANKIDINEYIKKNFVN